LYCDYYTYRDTCEEAAEKGVLSTAPLTRGPRRFKLMLVPGILPPLPPGTYLDL
jgi:hypothetical protein